MTKRRLICQQRSALLRTGLAAFLVMVCAADAIAKPPDFPAPPKSSVASVAQDMNLHGRITSIRMFTTRDEVEEVLDFYKEIWSEPVSRKGPNYAQEDRAMAPWRLITRVEDGYAMTVQVQAGDPGSWGYLAISALPEGGEPAPGASAPPSMRSVIEYHP